MEKFITRNNAMIVQIVCAILSLLMILSLSTGIRGISTGSYGELGSNVSSISLACTMFYIDFILVMLVIAYFIYSFVCLKKSDVISIVSTCIYGLAGIIGLSLLSTVASVSSLASGFSNGNWEMMLGTMFNSYDTLNNIDSVQMPLIIFVILQIGGIALSSFVIFGKMPVNQMANPTEMNGQDKEEETRHQDISNNQEKTQSLKTPQLNFVVCKNCGEKNLASYRYCKKCGQLLSSNNNKGEK